MMLNHGFKHLFAGLMLLGFSGCGSHFDYIQSYYYNEKFRYYMNKKTLEKAQTAELASKENLQDRFELDSNLGVVFSLLNKNNEAEKSFDEALKVIEKQFPQNNPEKQKALFTVYYNRGVFFQTQNKVDEALKDYQRALDIVPTSIETKTNIELLIQKQKDDQKKQGQGQSKPQDQNGEKPDNKESKDGEKNDDKKNDKPEDKKENGKDRKQNPKYQPRPFKSDQLSEGDVKKILGELSQQDKKIRSQFNKKDKEETGIEGKNEKDW